MKTALCLLGLSGLLATVPAVAQSDANHAAHHDDTKANATTPMSEGEVRRVDKANGKVTIKHGPLPNLGMPQMTMVFRVKDPAMLEQLKEGDKIRFVADKVDGAFTVMQVEVIR